MVQPKYDDVSDNPIYSVDSDQPAYLCKEFDCLDCTGDMQVVISGLSASNCNCILSAVPGLYLSVTSISGINGTHTLDRYSNCVWYLDDVGSVRDALFSEDTCDNEVTSVTSSVRIELIYAGGEWTLQVYATTGSPHYNIFDSTNTTDECPSAMVFTDTSECSPATATVTEL